MTLFIPIINSYTHNKKIALKKLEYLNLVVERQFSISTQAINSPSEFLLFSVRQIFLSA